MVEKTNTEYLVIRLQNRFAHWRFNKYHVLFENYDYKARQILQLNILWQKLYLKKH